MIRLKESIEEKKRIYDAIMNVQFIHEHVGHISCAICHDIISLFIYSQNRDIVSPFHIISDSNYICDECFYKLNVIKDNLSTLYYEENYLNYEIENHVFSQYVFDHDVIISSGNCNQVNFDMKYVDFWIGV
jgi:hypothetical protein